jgi:hypothetical protein
MAADNTRPSGRPNSISSRWRVPNAILNLIVLYLAALAAAAANATAVAAVFVIVEIVVGGFYLECPEVRRRSGLIRVALIHENADRGAPLRNRRHIGTYFESESQPLPLLQVEQTAVRPPLRPRARAELFVVQETELAKHLSRLKLWRIEQIRR